MDLMNFMSSDEFKQMSHDEKREAIRNLIHEINEDSSARAVLFNPEEQKSYSLNELIDVIGEEKVIDLLIRAMEQGDMTPRSFTKEELKEALKRKSNGTATSEDEQMISLFNHVTEESEQIQLNKNLTAIIVEFIDFAQNARHFNPTFGDFLTTFNIIATITGMYTNGTSLSKYQQAGPITVHHISKEIADDILKTWIDTCSEVPDDYMMLCALLEATQVYANKIKMCDGKIYKEILHDILPDIEMNENEKCDCCEEDCDCNGDCHCESGNGSNEKTDQPNIATPKTYTPNDQDMRDMLKE